MAGQEMWVHGTSGQLNVIDQGWGQETYDGTGLYLEGRVQVKTAGVVSQVRPYLWVHFHIPTPTSAESFLRLRKVMLRFSTDCDPAGMYPGPPRNYIQASQGFEQDRLDKGGVIIDLLHVNDGEIQIGEWEVGWQSSSIADYVVSSQTLDPPVQVRWGVGVSLRLLFKNQFFDEKRLLDLGKTPGQNPAEMTLFPIDPDWDGKPWLNTKRATNTKHAWLTSVGGEFITPTR